MTESDPRNMSSGTTSRWTRVVLVVSLALNLAVAGIVVGAMIKEGPLRGSRDQIRELSFGPFSDALTREDRRVLRDAFVARSGDPRNIRRELQQEFAALIAVLRSDPFEAQELRRLLDVGAERAQARQELGRTLIFDRVTAMSDADRRAFAERLEDGLTRRGSRQARP